MRLLMTVDAVGGVWTYAVDLARGLAAMDVQTTLAVCGPPPDAAELTAAQAIPGVRVCDGGAVLDWTAADAGELADCARGIAALARRERADVVQLNSPVLAALASFEVPVVGVCHSCVATWWDAVRGGPLPADFAWRSALLARGLAACDRLVAPTAAHATAVAARYGVRAEVVHNGRDPPIGHDAARRRMVFTAGRLWDEGKNFLILDAAAARIDAPLLAAGPLDGPQGQQVAPAHARTLGRLPAASVRRQMRAATVFASLALYEPFGLAVLEAAQAGCALVLSDIPTFRELWTGAAVFVPARDVAAAAAALQALLDAPAEAARLGSAARAHARRYDSVAQARAMGAVYRDVAAVALRA